MKTMLLCVALLCANVFGASVAELLADGHPVSVGPITPTAGKLWATTGTAFSATATPTLGASGTLGTLTFGNATSGTITITPVAGALGTRTLSMPAVSGTIITTGDTGSVTSTMILDGTIVNADVNASAEIAGTKIDGNFGTKDIVANSYTATASFILGDGNPSPTYKINIVGATQTTDSPLVTIPDMAGVNDTFAFLAKTQTMSGTTVANSNNSAITNDTTTNATMYPVWVTATSGNLPLKVTNSKLSFNPSTGVLVADGGFLSSGPLTALTLDSAGSTHVGTSLELGNADTKLARVSAGVISVEGVTVPTISSTNTITNKRVTPRITSITSSATPTINTDNCDCVTITALAANITSMTSSLSGTPTNFQRLIIRFKDDGTARTISWGASFEAVGVALPTTTVISKRLVVGFIYDTVTSKWGCVASAQEL